MLSEKKSDQWLVRMYGRKKSRMWQSTSGRGRIIVDFLKQKHLAPPSEWNTHTAG